MTERNVIVLKKKLLSLGFEKVLEEIDFNKTHNQDKFTIYHYTEKEKDQLMYILNFDKNNKDKVKLTGYMLGIRHIPIPQMTVGGITTRQLEDKLIKADELYNQYLNGNKDTGGNHLIKEANDELMNLLNQGKTGKELAHLLMFKYWPAEQWERFITNERTLIENYEAKLSVPFRDGVELTASEAYEKIKENFLSPTIKGMEKEHVISDEVIEQAQFELSYNRNWIAYNSISYFLEKGDVYFFRHRDEAREFSDNNISEYDDFKIIHAKSIRDFLQLIPYGKVLENTLTNLSNQKTSIMNQENLDYLKDSLKYLGFGDKLNETLEQKMQEGGPDFKLNANVEFNKKSFEATLNFRKSDSTDMYFFNNYHASLEKSNGEKTEQTFYLNKGKGITAKEAFNLLDGRSVHKDLVTKEGQPYKAWMQLDFENKDKNNNFEVRQFHENYGFDLKAAVEKFSIAELNDPAKEKALMQSLQKGNVQSVTIEKDGSSHKMFIEADPQYKKVTMYDSNMKLVAKESLEQYKTGIDKGTKAVKEDLAEDKKKDLKQEAKPEKEKLEKKKDKTLLPKKRESTKKGLGVS